MVLQAVFDSVGNRLPACNRWYTFAESLEVQCLGAVLHKILPRVLRLALEVDESLLVEAEGDNNDGEVAAWRIHAARKAKQCLEFMVETARTPQDLCIAAVATTPLDKLSARLQHLDTVGSSLAELADGRPKGLLAKCQRHFWRLMGQLYSEVPSELGAVDHHFRSPGDLPDQARSVILGLAASVWSRLEVGLASKTDSKLKELVSARLGWGGVGRGVGGNIALVWRMHAVHPLQHNGELSLTREPRFVLMLSDTIWSGHLSSQVP